MIKKSLKSCGLTIVLDGSENNTIHCLIKDQPCHSTLEKINTAENAIDESHGKAFCKHRDRLGR